MCLVRKFGSQSKTMSCAFSAGINFPLWSPWGKQCTCFGHLYKRSQALSNKKTWYIVITVTIVKNFKVVKLFKTFKNCQILSRFVKNFSIFKKKENFNNNILLKSIKLVSDKVTNWAVWLSSGRQKSKSVNCTISNFRLSISSCWLSAVQAPTCQRWTPCPSFQFPIMPTLNTLTLQTRLSSARWTTHWRLHCTAPPWTPPFSPSPRSWPPWSPWRTSWTGRTSGPSWSAPRPILFKNCKIIWLTAIFLTMTLSATEGKLKRVQHSMRRPNCSKI